MGLVIPIVLGLGVAANFDGVGRLVASGASGAAGAVAVLAAILLVAWAAAATLIGPGPDQLLGLVKARLKIRGARAKPEKGRQGLPALISQTDTFITRKLANGIEVLIRHRGLVTLGVAAFFFVFVSQGAFWNVVVSLWAVIGAGLVVSLVLEEQGEEIQLRAWLRRHSGQVGPFLQAIAFQAALLSNRFQTQPSAPPDDPEIRSFLETTKSDLQLAVEANEPTVSRLTRLHGSIQKVYRACDNTLYLFGSTDPAMASGLAVLRQQYYTVLVRVSLELRSIAEELLKESGDSTK